MNEWRLEYRGTRFPVREGELTLGRSSYASIVVNNPLASREHAVVRAVGGKLEVQDLGSKNGTFVNDRRLSAPYRLDVGDRIRVGTELIDVIRVTADDPEPLRAITVPGRIHPGRPETNDEATTDVSEHSVDEQE